MMFRHHMDPLYYDAKANAKIFVPQVDESQLTEEQKKIIESFPKEDRGEILEAHEYAQKGYGPGQGQDLTSMIETDQIEAAAKKHKLREAAAKERADRRKKQGQVEFKENPYDSEEKEYDENEKAEVKFQEGLDDSEAEENTYDSEFEEEFFGKKDPDLNKQLKNRKGSDEASDDQIDSSKQKQIYNPKDFKVSIQEDLNRELLKYQNLYKPSTGVEFKQYDRFGFDKNDELTQYLARDGDEAGFEYIPASEEQMAKIREIQAQMAFQGGREDIDKKVEDMNVEEKAVFDCLNDEQNVFADAYDELEDDFVLMLNEGKPALEQINQMNQPPMLDGNHENAGVMIIEGEPEEGIMQ